MACLYPDTHLLGLPVELRELIYDQLTADSPRLHMWDKETALHLSAPCTPPISLLLTHPVLRDEAPAHFHRTSTVCLHIDAYACSRLASLSPFTEALRSNSYLLQAQRLELRPTLNAGAERLAEAMVCAVSVLERLPKLKTVTVSWAEVLVAVYSQLWRPPIYKVMALRPLESLVGKVELVCGSCICPPPLDKERQRVGLEMTMRAIIGRGARSNRHAEKVVQAGK